MGKVRDFLIYVVYFCLLHSLAKISNNPNCFNTTSIPDVFGNVRMLNVSVFQI